MSLLKVTVTQILKEKSSSVFSVNEDCTVAAAVAAMNQARVGSVLVKRDQQVVGIFTERDVLVRVVSEQRDPAKTIVRDVMTAHFKSITKDTPVEDAMQLMTDRRVRHLPVLENGRLLGMISIGDVTRWLLLANEVEVDNLRKYVFSEYPG
ncbi:CBS domain-containing protein [Coraliomargarita parva]|uniref:CBS domain-containing protein n=1 Tax=Coraliomargarita parva TaxID=3014050 RepID=UPI0022B388E2|nr:CBS domain-containing protein [Coraliomargarita parva]